MKTFTCILLLMTSLCLVHGQSRDLVVKNLTTNLEKIAMKGHISGFSVAIVNAHETLYTHGFGYADIQQQKKYTENSIQTIASISKTSIGIALLKAQEMGKLNLDDAINTYLPFEVVNPYFPEEPITIRQLASHTSTIKDAHQYESRGYILYSSNNMGTKANKNFRTPEDIMPYGLFLKKILSKEGEWYKKKNFHKKKQGSIFEYSNIGAGLAALVLENAVDQPFNEFTKTYIFEPLEMTQTGWFLSNVDRSMLTKLYTGNGTQLAPYQLVNYPDGAMITSSTDLAKYLSELIAGYRGKGTLLSNESYQELFSPNLSTAIHEDKNENKYNDEYEMGIFMGISAKGQIGHTGGDPGVSSFMFFDTASQIGKLLMVNTDLSKEGVKSFIEIWKTLESYETKL